MNGCKCDKCGNIQANSLRSVIRWLLSFALAAMFITALVGVVLLMQHHIEWLFVVTVMFVVCVLAAIIRGHLD